jgi:hypothetical protein
LSGDPNQPVFQFDPLSDFVIACRDLADPD